MARILEEERLAALEGSEEYNWDIYCKYQFYFISILNKLLFGKIKLCLARASGNGIGKRFALL